MRLTKIVATLGPASWSPEVIEKLIRAGVNVFRLNFSHGEHEQHQQTLEAVRAQATAAGRHIAVLQDLCGPKIRVGPLAADSVELETGQTVRIRRDNRPGDAAGFGSTYENLVDDLQVGSTVLLDDGNIALVVLEKNPDEVVCRINVGGRLLTNKGINLPGVQISAPSVTEKDMNDLLWGIKHEVDYVALSFVRSADDVRTVKRFLHDRNYNIPVIAKIEKPEAIESIDEIIDTADALMVARGDLGVEMRLEAVPTLQKRIIALCAAARKPVITATQMLQSMTNHPVPTRAEVSDVANAILDGSDAVMLSGETAVGQYPVQTVHTMARIAEEADNFAASRLRAQTNFSSALDPEALVSSSLTHSVASLTATLKPAVVVVSTASGYSARNISKEMLPIPILALSDSERTCRQMVLLRGTTPELAQGDVTLDAIAAHAVKTLRKLELASDGDLFVLVAGFPVGKAGTTNTVQVRRLETVRKTTGGTPGRARWTLVEKDKTYDYVIDYATCIGCGVCVRQCPHGIYALESDHAVVNEDNLARCIRDRMCVRLCPTGAITITERLEDESSENLDADRSGV